MSRKGLEMNFNELSCNNIKNDMKEECNANNIIKNCLSAFPPKQFALLSTLIGLLIIDGLDADDQNSIGNFIVGIGQTILVSAAQQQLLESNKQKNNSIRNQINMLKKQINSLESQLD